MNELESRLMLIQGELADIAAKVDRLMALNLETAIASGEIANVAKLLEQVKGAAMALLDRQGPGSSPTHEFEFERDPETQLIKSPIRARPIPH